MLHTTSYLLIYLRTLKKEKMTIFTSLPFFELPSTILLNTILKARRALGTYLSKQVLIPTYVRGRILRFDKILLYLATAQNYCASTKNCASRTSSISDPIQPWDYNIMSYKFFGLKLFKGTSSSFIMYLLNSFCCERWKWEKEFYFNFHRYYLFTRLKHKSKLPYPLISP